MAIQSGQLPCRPDDFCSWSSAYQDIWNIIEACWYPSSNRPSIQDIRSWLDCLLRGDPVILPELPDIASCQATVAIRPSMGRLNRSDALKNITHVVTTRFQDASHSDIALNREALSLCPVGHPDRAYALAKFAAALTAQYERLGNLENLMESIALSRLVLELRPESHPGRYNALENLASLLKARAGRTDVPEDLEESKMLSRLAEGLRLED